MNYLIIISVSLGLLSLSLVLGKKLALLINLRSELRYTSLGLALILAVLFIAYIPFVYLQASAFYTNLTFVIILIGLCCYGFSHIKTIFDHELKWTILTLIYVSILVFFSSRMTLGEQSSDAVFYFTIVQRNIDSAILGQFNGYYGGIYPSMMIGIQYAYQAYYQLFSAILWALRLVFTDRLLDHAIYMWVGNICFYYISFEAIINVYLLFKSKTSFLLNIIFSGFFLGSLYYNLSLPHIGVVFMVALLTNLLVYLFAHYEQRSCKWLLVVFSLAMISCASSGLFISFFLAYAYIISKALSDDQNIISDSYLIALPIMIYSVLFINNFVFTVFCVVVEMILVLGHYLVKHKRDWQPRLLKLLKLLSNIIPLIFIAWGILNIRLSDYGDTIMHYIAQHSRYDRIQDYFVLNDSEDIIKNVLYYISLASLLLHKKYRPFSAMLIIVILTFGNPLVMPFVIRYMTKIDAYQRIFYLIFNIGLIMIGFNILLNEIIQHDLVKKVAVGGLILIYGYFSWYQLTNYYHFTFEPDEGFNPLYKAHQTQIDAINALSYEIKIDKLICPRVISQSSATLMLEPNITLINGVPDRYDPTKSYPDDPVLHELVNIFHAPIYEGDDAERFVSDYMHVAELIDEAEIDFILVQRQLHVKDQQGEWVPLYTYL